jgi:hypothetical protein
MRNADAGLTQMTTGKNADAGLTLSLAFWYSGIYLKQPRSPGFFSHPLFDQLEELP